jgi:hypothetical protein
VRVPSIAVVVQQLQRDFLMQRRIPRAVHLGRHPLADAIAKDEAAPSRPVRCRIRTGDTYRRASVLARLASRAVQRRDVLDDLEVAHEAAFGWRELPLGLAPVDLPAVGDGSGKVGNWTIFGDAAVEIRDALDEPEMADQLALRDGDAVFRGLPIDWRAVRNRRRKIR